MVAGSLDPGILFEFLVIFGFSIAALFVCNRLRIPGIVGYLAAGLLIGPSGLRLVTDTEMIGRYAELGVILLLFTIGLEISFRELLTARRMLVVGGALQLLLTGGAVFGVALLLGLDPSVAVVFGMMIALSSTTIVMSALDSRGETGSPHGRFLLSVLIFQDLAVVPFMLLLPLLAGEAPLAPGQVPLTLLLGGLVLVVILVSLRWVVPALLYHAARVRSSEVFLFSVIGVCVLTVYVSGMLGLSFAFGAFLAGLLIADSEFRHEALTLVLPFRDIFAGLFFVSIGMLLETEYLLAQPLLVGGLTLGIIVVKALFGMLSARGLGLPICPVVIGGLSLAHVGEFSFVIATTALTLGVLPAGAYQLFLNAAVLSMAAAPFLIQLGRAVGDRLAVAVPQRGGEAEPRLVSDHLVIVGYGLSGRNMARIARESGIDYTVIEANPETVRHELAAGEPIFFGDAAHAGVLRSAGADRARALVCVISDPGAVARIVRAARALNPGLFIACRVRYAAEVEALRENGADEVIAEEFEALIEPGDPRPLGLHGPVRRGRGLRRAGQGRRVRDVQVAARAGRCRGGRDEAPLRPRHPDLPGRAVLAARAAQARRVRTAGPLRRDRPRHPARGVDHPEPSRRPGAPSGRRGRADRLAVGALGRGRPVLGGPRKKRGYGRALRTSRPARATPASTSPAAGPDWVVVGTAVVAVGAAVVAAVVGATVVVGVAIGTSVAEIWAVSPLVIVADVVQSW